MQLGGNRWSMMPPVVKNLLIINGLMFLAILGLILGLKFRSFTLLICASVLLVSAVTRYTSGMYFTSFFFWLFLKDNTAMIVIF